MYVVDVDRTHMGDHRCIFEKPLVGVGHVVVCVFTVGVVVDGGELIPCGHPF